MKIAMPSGGVKPERAVRAIKEAHVSDVFAEAAPGDFGAVDAVGARALEALRDAVDAGVSARGGIEGLIREELEGGPGFAVPRLAPEHHQFLSAAQLIVTADLFQRMLEVFVALEEPEGQLDMDGLPELLESGTDPHAFITRVLRLAGAYVRRERGSSDAATSAAIAAEVAAGVAAFLELIRRSALMLCNQSSLRPMTRALARQDALSIAGYPYDGLTIRPISDEASAGLMSIGPEEIVGNEEYLSAGLRLARDVAGYDFEAGRNPKRVNPILFGLGEPGCGKTVTAHAVGNAFLSFCSEHEIPARFITIQRTDWASSYQNASAMNLVKIFREDVYGFDGVCGVYWPDIDTAFASRQSGQLRSEEKQNLGAVFGIFDGTLLPKDGKWFLMCDANTLHMDEATISRIAQNPMTVQGPTTPAHYIHLMRALKLADVAEFVDVDEAGWARIGERCVELGLTGRNVDAICGNVRGHIQDFEYPDAYFEADSARRAEIIEELCKRVETSDILAFLEEWAEWRREAEASAEEEKFSREVSQIVRRLNASRAASSLID